LRWSHLAPALVDIGEIYQPAVLSELQDLIFQGQNERGRWMGPSPDKALIQWMLNPVVYQPRCWDLFEELQVELIAAQHRGEIVITVLSGLASIEQLVPGALPDARSLAPYAWISPLNFAKNTVKVANGEWQVIAIVRVIIQQSAPAAEQPASATVKRAPRPADPDAEYCKHRDHFVATHRRYPSQSDDEQWCKEHFLLPARDKARDLRNKHLSKEVRRGGRGKNLVRNI